MASFNDDWPCSVFYFTVTHYYTYLALYHLQPLLFIKDDLLSMRVPCDIIIHGSIRTNNLCTYKLELIYHLVAILVTGS